METLTLLTVSFILFFAFILRRVAANVLDVFDGLALCVVFLIPPVFLAFEDLSKKISIAVGVEYPFVVMFGLIASVMAFTIYGLLTKLHRTRAEMVALAQHIAIEDGARGE